MSPRRRTGQYTSLLTLTDAYLTGYHAAHVGCGAPGKSVTDVGDGMVGRSAALAA
ncbi:MULTISPECIES: hypothetical protein [unclassified Streptomyces]|uniref:hypothetical protein n=1 Tax=unclassified Streptomyces TaxID=2593676 RepID=UPI0033200A39